MTWRSRALRCVAFRCERGFLKTKCCPYLKADTLVASGVSMGGSLSTSPRCSCSSLVWSPAVVAFTADKSRSSTVFVSAPFFVVHRLAAGFFLLPPPAHYTCRLITPRRYASAVYTAIVCLSVCLSQVGVLQR